MFSRVRRELTLLKSKYQKKLSPRGSTSQRPNSAEPTTVGRSQVSSDCLSVLGGTINSYVTVNKLLMVGRQGVIVLNAIECTVPLCLSPLN